MKRIGSVPEKSHGPGPIFFAFQRVKADLLVTTGSDRSLVIRDRHGTKLQNVNLAGMCGGLSWDRFGETLAVICEGSTLLVLWDAALEKAQRVEIGFRDDPCLVVWALTDPLLAVGTVKGNVLIYDQRTASKTPIFGKHTKRINAGAWSRTAPLLALTADDRNLSVSNQEGDSMHEIRLTADPSLLNFESDDLIGLVLAKTTLLIVHLSESPPQQRQVQLETSVLDFHFLDGGQFALVGYSSARFTLVSVRNAYVVRTFSAFQDKPLLHFTFNRREKLIAASAENQVKLIRLVDGQNEETIAVQTIDDEKAADWLELSEDGQLLALSSPSGALHMYLTRLPIVGSAFFPRIAILSSLKEVSVSHALNQSASPLVIEVDIEPSLLAVGPNHLAAAMNNRVWFYSLPSGHLVREREYLGIVTEIKLNGQYAALRFSSSPTQLHSIELNSASFTPPSPATSIALTDDLLVYGTQAGAVESFLLDEWAVVHVHRHDAPIALVAPDRIGARVCFVDSRGEAFLLLSVSDVILKVPISFSPRAVLWARSTCVLLDSSLQNFHVFSFWAESVEGPKLELVTKERIPVGQQPLLLVEEEAVICQTESGRLTQIKLPTDFRSLLKLQRFAEAWRYCEESRSEEDWLLLGEAALESLNVPFAEKVFRRSGNAGVVLSLQPLEAIEERNLLAAHIAVLLARFPLAQQLFLLSSRPKDALRLRVDLLDWDTALLLARRLDPAAVPVVSREFAAQLEFSGEFARALELYEKARGGSEPHNELCEAGIARCALRTGDVKLGVQTGLKLRNNHALLRECGEILEELNHAPEAALFFELADDYERSLRLYLRVRNTRKAEQLVEKTSDTALISEFARLKEADGKHREALKAFIRADDPVNAVRILLERLKAPGDAVKMAKESGSKEAAKLVARFFQKMNDVPAAVEFLVLSDCNDEAFRLASAAGQMDAYAAVLAQNEAPAADLLSVAIFYEQDKHALQAGKFYHLAQSHRKAVKLLLQAAALGDHEEEALSLAVKSAAACREESGVRAVIEFLIGEADGVPRDFKFLFRLYMGLEQFTEAAKTAQIIAREEQNAGNYRHAHSLLRTMIGELRRKKLAVPAELTNALLLLHSYLLAKIKMKKGDNESAAFLLIRLANNLFQFPSHGTEILTSATVQCLKANFLHEAHELGSILLKEHEVQPKFRRRIEQFMRKTPAHSLTPTQRPMTKCASCSEEFDAYEMTCPFCKTQLDFCSASGQHKDGGESSDCEECGFGYLLREGSECAMCNKEKTHR